MDFQLIKAPLHLKHVFTNLMQFYYYDFSEYLSIDTKENGLFESYPYLDEYWENQNDKFPYLIKADQNFVGFVLVKSNSNKAQDNFCIAEFFILRKYRLNRIGEAVAIEIFNLHRGEWEVSERISNKPAQLFWKKTISKYTDMQFTERVEADKVIQNFKNH